MGRGVHSGSRGLTGARKGVGGFIRFRMASLVHSQG